MQFNEGTRGAYVIAPGLTMAELYKIVYDRLDNCRVETRTSFCIANKPLEAFVDIESFTQRVCREVELHLGIYPNIGE